MKHLNVRRALWLSLVALLPCVAKAQDESSKITLNLDQAIEIGLSESPTIKVAELEIDRIDYTRKQAWGSLLPVIAASADYTRTVKKQMMYMDGFDMGLGDGGIEIGRDNSWTAGFAAQLPIIAPQLWKNVKLTEADVATAVEKARSSKLTLINEIEKAYYNLILSQDSYKVLSKSYESAKLNANDYRNKFDQGLASEYDVLRSEVEVRNQEPGLLQAENAIKLSALQLKVLIGMDSAIELAASSTLDDYEGKMYADILNTDTNLDNNTTLRQLDLQTEYLERALEVQKMAYLPTLSASALYTWISSNNDFKFNDYVWDPYATVGLSFSYTLFQGGSRYYNVKQSKVGINQLAYQRSDVKEQLAMQVEASLNNIEKSIKQVASNKEGVRQAERAVEIMEKSFEVGSATFIQVNDANLALTSSRLAYNQAIYDYLTAKAELDLVLGNTNLDSYTK